MKFRTICQPYSTIYPSEMKMQQGASERRVYKREAHTQATSNDAASSFPMGISVSVFIFTYILFLLPGCSSNSILTTKLSITPAEQKRLMGAVDRNSNNQLYESNLEKIYHPKEKELLKEAGLVNSEVFSSGYKVLVDWYENKLSRNSRSYLASNCTTMVGNFSEKFPLTETSIACAGWWLEQKSKIRKMGNKQASDRSVRSRKVVFSQKDRLKWEKYKHLEFADALQNSKDLDFSQASHLAKKAIITAKNCSYKNANAALIFKLEEFLSNEKVYHTIEKIYQKSLVCYRPDGDITERLHLRMGVLRLIHGNYDLASMALKKNQLESAPVDGSRSLFWLGVIEDKKNKRSHNPYWEQMTRENPFGFFSVIANDRMHRDPMDAFVPDNTIIMQNRILGGWNENNLQAFLFDLFYSKQDSTALKKLSRKVTAIGFPVNKNLYLYWAVNHSIAENDRSSVLMLSKYLDTQKERKVSARLLSLNFPIRYAEEILNASKKVDPLLVLSLIRQESAFDSNAQSSADARGLMQLLPSTARIFEKHVTAKKLYEPETNIKLGIMFLEKLFEKYNGRTEYVLAAYNAGPNRVDAWTGRVSNTTPLLFMEYMPFRETRNYVSTIMRNYYWYKRLMNDQKNDHIARIFLERNNTSIWKPENMIAMLEEKGEVE